MPIKERQLERLHPRKTTQPALALANRKPKQLQLAKLAAAVQRLKIATTKMCGSNDS
jgi:hypothetical protein